MSVLSKANGVGVISGIMIYIMVDNLRQRSSYCYLFGACVFIGIPRLKLYVELYFRLIFCVNLKFKKWIVILQFLQKLCCHLFMTNHIFES
jgi:hypothetical protein